MSRLGVTSTNANVAFGVSNASSVVQSLQNCNATLQDTSQIVGKAQAKAAAKAKKTERTADL